MKVPFFDLRVNNEEELEELTEAVRTVFKHGRILLGPEVEKLESVVAKRCNKKYAVGVNSGTDALYLALKSIPVLPGDEVITTSLSWIAVANAIHLTGAKPVFADITDDLNIDPASIKKLITGKTKAILPVHYTGKMCKMYQIMDIAKEYKLQVIEDASQSFGASYRGNPVGSFGELACFSLNPMKILAACGEAGIILTDKENIYEKLISLRYNGTVNRELCIEPSLNCRIDTLQAAILLKRLERVDGIIQRKREIASLYNKKLKNIVKIPFEADGEYDVYFSYIIQVDRRDELKSYLESNGIETKIQHPYLMSEQPAYKNLTICDIQTASYLVKRILSIPVHEKIKNEEIDYISEKIIEFYKI